MYCIDKSSENKLEPLVTSNDNINVSCAVFEFVGIFILVIISNVKCLLWPFPDIFCYPRTTKICGIDEIMVRDREESGERHMKIKKNNYVA